MGFHNDDHKIEIRAAAPGAARVARSAVTDRPLVSALIVLSLPRHLQLSASRETIDTYSSLQ
jgi:hypothetical protein